LPIRKIGAQAIEVEIGKRLFCAGKISQRTVKNGAGAREVIARLVMKSDGQLHHALEVPAQRLPASRCSPGVFERLMGVKKMPRIKQAETATKVRTNLGIPITGKWQESPLLTVFNSSNDLDYT
jgi:hypothetical protein